MTGLAMFCGGHGSCLTDPGDAMLFEKRDIQWLDRYLKGDQSVDTGPGFEWVDQDGRFRGDPDSKKFVEEGVEHKVFDLPDGRTVSITNQAMPGGGWVAGGAG